MRHTVIAEFEKQFKTPPTLISRAPGRVNLIGEHTDYNDGFVLPMAIDRNIWIAARPRNDETLNVHSVDFGETVTIKLDQLTDASFPHWTHHLRGVWYLLGQRGTMPPGADLVMAGDVPIGAGLSSSAAIEIALIELALTLIGQTWSQPEKALFGVKVEHEFSHVPCGIMDQMASAVSQEGAALLIDCRSLETTPVYLPDNVAVVVMDTAKRRQLADSAYAERRRQCEEAATILGVASLRDAPLETVIANQTALGDVRFRRARHIVTENNRVMEFVKALKDKNLSYAGALMNASHASLRDDYEVSCKELDIITELARQQVGCYGARMTGGGFGGCAVALVKPDAVARLFAAISEPYQMQSKLTPVLYEFKPAAGSQVVQK